MILQQLRKNPLETLKTSSIKIITAKGAFMTDLGGSMKIKESKLPGDGNVYQFELSPDTKEKNYFYPYRPEVGSVSVPIKSALDGHLVLTGGMNGCAMSVYKQMMLLFFIVIIITDL